ncbi:quinon protein alcohol dehydrogenase-like superfamily [Mycena sanguinolenta]|nr:quinon protein alcohol dehydrogenase-like superfamily [Mycena sanguinolenta]
MASPNCTNTDISGIGVRSATYAQNLLSFVPAVVALVNDGKISKSEREFIQDQSTNILLTAFGLLLSAIIQASTSQGLDNYHLALVLNLSWMNNTNTFIYLLLLLHRKIWHSPPKKWDWAVILRHIVGQSSEATGAQKSSPQESEKIETEYVPGHIVGRSSESSEGNTADSGKRNQVSGHIPDQSLAAKKADKSVRKKSDTRKWSWAEFFHYILTQSSMTKRVNKSGPEKSEIWLDSAVGIGSLHLSLMGALGVWLWVNPTDFGSSRSCPAGAAISVFGHAFSMGSPPLRVFSLIVYAAVLVPFANLVLPTGLILVPYFLSSIRWKRYRKAIEAEKEAGWCVGLGLAMLFTINVFFIVDTELAIARNEPRQGGQDKLWTLGQTLALLLLVLPTRALVQYLVSTTPLALPFMGETALIRAVKGFRKYDGDVPWSDVHRWIWVIADAPVKVDNRWLLRASVAGQWEIVRFLVDNGASPSYGPDWETAIPETVKSEHSDKAAEQGRLEIIRFLLKHGLDVNATNTNEQTALDLAIASKQSEIVSFLLTLGTIVARQPPRVTSVAFSPDSMRVVSGSYGCSILIWNKSTGEKKPLIGHADWVESMAFSPNGELVVSGSKDRTVRIWDAVTGEEQRQLGTHTEGVLSVAFSPDGVHVVSASGQDAYIWDLATGAAERKLAGHSGNITSVAFSPDGRRLVSGSHDKTVRVWDLMNGQSRSLEGHFGPVTCVASCPQVDDKRVVSGSGDNTVRIWDTETGEAQRVIDAWYWIMSVAFSHNNRVVYAAGDSVYLYDIAAEEILDSLEAHTERVTAVALSPDGVHIVSGSEDSTVRIWSQNPKTAHSHNWARWLVSRMEGMQDSDSDTSDSIL